MQLENLDHQDQGDRLVQEDHLDLQVQQENEVTGVREVLEDPLASRDLKDLQDLQAHQDNLEREANKGQLVPQVKYCDICNVVFYFH